MNNPRLTPYDTGGRAEPRPWQKNRAEVLQEMIDGDPEDIGNVDFNDDENRTVATVHVSRHDGKYTVHVIPHDDDLWVELHGEDGDTNLAVTTETEVHAPRLTVASRDARRSVAYIHGRRCARASTGRVLTMGTLDEVLDDVTSREVGDLWIYFERGLTGKSFEG